MLAAATLEVLILTDSGEFDDSAHRQRDGEDEEKCCKQFTVSVDFRNKLDLKSV